MRIGGKKDEVMVKRFEVCGRWRGRTAVQHKVKMSRGLC